MKVIFAIDRCSPEMLEFGVNLLAPVIQAVALSLENKGNTVDEDYHNGLNVICTLGLAKMWPALDELFDTTLSVTIPFTEKELLITRETLFDRWEEVKRDYELDKVLLTDQTVITETGSYPLNELIPKARMENLRQTLYKVVETFLDTEHKRLQETSQELTIRFAPHL